VIEICGQDDSALLDFLKMFLSLRCGEARNCWQGIIVDEGWLTLGSIHRRDPVKRRELGELPQLFPIAGVIGRLGDGYSGLHRCLSTCQTSY
jgi:hypothetical protein